MIGTGTIQYAWSRDDGKLIADYPAQRYIVKLDDVGHSLRCFGSEKLGWTTTTTASSYTIPVPMPTPRVAQGALKLTCQGFIPGATTTWLRDGVVIATGPVMAISQSDRGTNISCQQGSAVSAPVLVGPGPNGQVQPDIPSPLKPPRNPSDPSQGSVTGRAVVHRSLKCRSGSFGGSAAIDYEWIRDGRPTGVHGERYRLLAQDRGSVLTCLITLVATDGTRMPLLGYSVGPVRMHLHSYHMPPLDSDGSMVRASRCTIIGTGGDDRIVGTSGDDIICGRGGNDVIFAGAGDDVIDGGTGADRLQGGAGDDIVYGGPGSDWI
jgi:hypothetical protein